MSHPRYFNQSQKQCISERQSGLCAYCRCPMINEEIEFYHHVLRWQDGGATNLENGVVLCEICHKFVHNAGHYQTEILLLRAEFKYANWKDNAQYALYLKKINKQEIIDDRTIFSNQTLFNIDEYWSKLKKIEKIEKKVSKNLKSELTKLKNEININLLAKVENSLKIRSEANSNLIKSHHSGINTMSIVTSSDDIANAIQILNAYAQNLEENYRIHYSQIMHLQSGWADSQHAGLSDEFSDLLIPIQQSISRTNELINKLQHLYQLALEYESNRY